MTAKQIIKKLEAAGIEITNEIQIERDEVTVCVGYEVHNDRYAWCNEEETAKLENKVRAALGWKSGYRTGSGAQVVTNYKVKIDTLNCL
jgi:hypothetical protein